MSTCDHICRECGQVMNCQHCRPYQLPVDRARIADLEASVRELVAHATGFTHRLAQDHPAVIRARKALGVKAT
mgnify:CR=1 FL=1